MILHAWKCSNPDCGDIFEEYTTVDPATDRVSPVPCQSCKGMTQIHWTSTGYVPAAHASERTVIFRNPKTGEWTAPDKPDTPLSPRQRARGYERVEFNSIHDIHKFEKATGFRCEKAHYYDYSETTRDDGESRIDYKDKSKITVGAGD